ncbi:MAG: SAM-dependent methyltransferase [Bacteroidetes bacterium]|nr:MAG: SAM-dependent methyltransferase [Bacteroidota bacterium]
MAIGNLYLFPNTLGSEQSGHVIPAEVAGLIQHIRHFSVEDVRSARRLLRKLDRQFPIDDSQFYVLNKKTEGGAIEQQAKCLLAGNDLAIISEAGCPGVADPGARLVARAHELGIRVQPLVGPSSILLALMGSGFNGQHFSFHGYLPKDRKDRIRSLKQFEYLSQKEGSTHLFMDTPFRNMNVLEDLLNELHDETKLSIASNLTLPNEKVQTYTVREWRKLAYDLNKVPVLFSIGISQS